MKTLSLRLIIPLTIISFVFITKWWYALPEDAPATMYKGFPLIYSGPAWHTSLAYQFFVVEFIIDLLTYFLCWFILIYSINRFWFTIKPVRWTTISLWSLTLLIIAYYAIIAGLFNHAYDFKRPYPIKIIATGYEFFWQHTQRSQ
ncbi:hypothetical protein A4H97_30500 [Niastella yeongjuensis]|uniref:Uncharacterized protein n=1 Tax=Niastella yeongjuensis TaxID=354355 RepID=A0A1V9EP80_9BACT|nr:hypothetical protein [Niastella yeongjuensis]OQP47940.1 hypothetical protein A4H97_30500 [Niastella yeongjuensis]SEP48064.1 hypothetical protein SAMN05660816_06698 [Niastella yeongjuensis]